MDGTLAFLLLVEGGPDNFNDVTPIQPIFVKLKRKSVPSNS